MYSCLVGEIVSLGMDTYVWKAHTTPILVSLPCACESGHEPSATALTPWLPACCHDLPSLTWWPWTHSVKPPVACFYFELPWLQYLSTANRKVTKTEGKDNHFLITCDPWHMPCGQIFSVIQEPSMQFTLERQKKGKAHLEEGLPLCILHGPHVPAFVCGWKETTQMFSVMHWVSLWGLHLKYSVSTKRTM